MVTTGPAAAPDRLRPLPLFTRLSDEELARVDAVVDEIEVPPGYVLLRQGDPARDAFVVLAGRGDLVVDDNPVATIGPGSIVGDVALLDFGPQPATAVSATEMALLVIGRSAFASLMHMPGFAAALVRVEVERIRAANNSMTTDARRNPR